MGKVTMGLKQIYGGFKTMFGRGAKPPIAQASKPSYTGPSLIDVVKKQPLALPVPTAEQLAKDVPRVCVPKVLNGTNLSELRMSQEILADGTHVRYFRKPGNNEVLIKMADKGSLHQEWIHPDSKDYFTYIKMVGDKERYVVQKSGNYLQTEKRSIQYKDGINQVVSTNDLYHTDAIGRGFHRQDVQGFNGKSSSQVDARGTMEVQKPDWNNKANRVDYHQEDVTYNMKNIAHKDGGLTENTYQYLYKFGTDNGQNAMETLASDLRIMTQDAKTHFRNFDEVIFEPYKA